MAEPNADVPIERRIELRAGINVGDVSVEGSDIYGDGVKIAAGLERLADPGGICISREVRDDAADGNSSCPLRLRRRGRPRATWSS
jgi:class 3 adenylate cyclase